MSEKTHAEITAEMSNRAKRPDFVSQDVLKSCADELDAAHKREMDALKQRCAELDAEVAAKDEVIKRLNDAIAEEQKRHLATTENPSAVGDAAKLREVVGDLLYMAERYVKKTPTTESVIFDAKTKKEIRTVNYYDVIAKAQAALAAPPRNCDVGTVEEQFARFRKFCKKDSMDSFESTAYCAYECPCGNNYDCKLAWAQMPYEEGGAK